MDTKDKLIEKLKEYIEYLIRYPRLTFKMDKFESEISALEKQIAEQESITFKEPEFDEATVKKLDMVRELANKKAGKKEQKSKPLLTAEKYLEIWLGSNMNTETLKWKAIVEFAEDYHKSRLKETMPTDEKIDKWAKNVNQRNFSYSFYDGLITGAKYLKSEIEKRNK
uniref:Uncharacterized protein n=1 Tax=viral metagenome TaxID=1070528 RepID=A0A6M3K2C1_9ZZZZ